MPNLPRSGTPDGHNNTISAGGDLFADTGGLAIVGLPGFGIVSRIGGICGTDLECAGFGNPLEFETGIVLVVD